jgi:hypothetical protein
MGVCLGRVGGLSDAQHGKQQNRQQGGDGQRHGLGQPPHGHPDRDAGGQPGFLLQALGCRQGSQGQAQSRSRHQPDERRGRAGTYRAGGRAGI